jgi:hypothetical protein
MIQHNEKSKRVNRITPPSPPAPLAAPAPTPAATVKPVAPSPPAHVDDCFTYDARGEWTPITPPFDPFDVEKHGYIFASELGDMSQLRIFESDSAADFPYVLECCPFSMKVTFVFIGNLAALLRFLREYEVVFDVWKNENEVAFARSCKATDEARAYKNRRRDS